MWECHGETSDRAERKSGTEESATERDRGYWMTVPSGHILNAFRPLFFLCDIWLHTGRSRYSQATYKA